MNSSNSSSTRDTNQQPPHVVTYTDNGPEYAAKAIMGGNEIAQEGQRTIAVLQRAAGALSGIGSMLQVGMAHCDEQLDQTLRSQASDVFEFFGEVIKLYADKAYQHMEDLDRVAGGLQPTCRAPKS